MSGEAGPAVAQHEDTGRTGFKTGVAWLFSGQVLSLAAGLAQSIIVVRVLGPAGQGQYAIAVVVLGLSTLALGQATIVGAIHYTANGQLDRSDIAAACSATVVAGSLACWAILGAGTLTGLIAVAMPGVSAAATLAVAVSVPMLLTRQFASALLTGSERFADAAMLEVIQSVGAAVMIGATLMILPTVEGMFAAFVVATGVSGSIGVLRVNRLGVRWFGWPKRAVLTRLIHFGLRAAVGSAFQFLTYRLDFALVNLLASTQALGIYSVASRFAELLWVLPGAVGGALFAVRSRDPGAGSAGQTARAFWGAGTVTVAGAVALALAAPIALPLLYGEAMTAAVAPLLILVPGAVLLGTSAVVANDVAARGRPGLISAIAIAVATLTVVLDIVMIPWLGIAGAAAASSIAYLAYGVMTVGAYLRVTGTHLTEFARAAGQLGSGMRLRL